MAVQKNEQWQYKKEEQTTKRTTRLDSSLQNQP